MDILFDSIFKKEPRGESAHLLKVVFNNSPHPIIIYDRDEYCLFCNRAAENLIPYNCPTDIQQRRLGKILPFYKQKEIQDYFLSALEGKEVKLPEISYSIGQEKKFVCGHIVPIRNGDETVSAAIAYLQDVTEEVNYRNLLAGVVNNSLLAIFAYQEVFNEEGEIVDFIITYYNELAVKMGMISPGKIGERLLTVFPALKDTGYFQKYVQVAKTGENIDMELPSAIRSDVWFQVTAAKMDNGLIVTCKDITERKNAEAAIQHSEQLLRNSQKLSGTGSYEWDLRNNTIFWSPQHYRLWEFEMDTPVDFDKVAERYHPEDKERVKNALHQAVAERKDFQEEFRIVLSGNRVKHMYSTAFLRYDEQGEPISMIGAVTDITDKKNKEATLKQRNQELKQTRDELRDINEDLEFRVYERTYELMEANSELKALNADLDNFIYTVSHDLKAPVNNIGRIIELMKGKEGMDAKTRESWLGLIEKSVDQFQDTLQGLHHEIRNKKEKQPENDITNLPDIVDKVRQVLEPQIIEAGARLEEDYEFTEIYVNERFMNSVLYNLLSNAVKYRSPERKPKIYISTYKTAECNIIKVTDNGLGMSPEQLNRLFNRFQRFHPEIEGTGLGLFLVKRIVERLGGEIKVESEENKGSAFYLIFPVND